MGVLNVESGHAAPRREPRHGRRSARPAVARRAARLGRDAGRGLRLVPGAAAGGPPPLATDAPGPGELDALFPAPDAWSAVAACGRTLPRIPGYEVEAILGRGGMGVVYKARHLRLNRLVALKMMLAGALRRAARAGPLPREAEAVAGLQHPNIVQVYEVGEHGRPAVLLAGVRRGRQPGPASWPARRSPPARPPTLVGDAGRGHAGGPPRRDRPPRPEAGQRPAHRRRHAQDHRLRPGPAPRRRGRR